MEKGYKIYYTIDSLKEKSMLNNKLGITSQIELANLEERITKLKAVELFDTGKINDFEVGLLKILLENM